MASRLSRFFDIFLQFFWGKQRPRRRNKKCLASRAKAEKSGRSIANRLASAAVCKGLLLRWLGCGCGERGKKCLPQWGKVARASVTDEVVSDNELNEKGANGVVE